mmetsp:Transcript_47813/g.77582  ORF Transcript_47813/g.77582 Transcript_47813/m.77582 type:complete len:115 (-) Transcript_47813:46-390(-)
MGVQGVSLWKVVAGIAMIVHAGCSILADKRAALEAAEPTEEVVARISAAVFLEVLLGSALALWGSIGEFKPIRLGDSKKPRWESVHARQDFQSYRSRAKLLRPLLTGIPAPPDA